MARRRGIVLVLVAIAAAGCGFAGVPGMGPGFGGSRPSVEEPDDPPVPRFTAPVISDEAMERAVQAGLARSDDETWRKIQGCLTPGRSQSSRCWNSCRASAAWGPARSPASSRFARPASIPASAARACSSSKACWTPPTCSWSTSCASTRTPAARARCCRRWSATARRPATSRPPCGSWKAGSAPTRPRCSRSRPFARQQQAQIQSAQGRLGALMGAAASAPR